MMSFQHAEARADQPAGDITSIDALLKGGRRIRIGIFNVKFSPNLGDGLLSECLEAELRDALPMASIEAFDLAGRTEYVRGRGQRAWLLTALHHSPRFVRHAVAETALRAKLQRDLRPRWREVLRSLDAVIIGGGNLLSDVDLNFPLKLDAAMQEVRAAKVPCGIFGVGVSDNWSGRGRSLFRRAFSDVEQYFASVREARSAEIWQRELGPIGVKSARVVHDPGLLASLHFPRAHRGGMAAPLVGLGLTHPIALKYHSDERAISSKEQADWYIAFARACLARGWSLAVFTNGSPEDETYMAELRPRLSSLAPAGAMRFVPRFDNPGQLAGFVSTLDLLLAHRLHANIAAYSYAIPHIGFSWDVKLKNFVSRVGRAKCICTVGVDPVDDVVELAAHELAVGVEPVRYRAVLSEARDDVARLAEAVRGAILAKRETFGERPARTTT